MSSSFLNDIFLTHSIVNFLQAGYQGAFAALNLLSQLSFQHFNPDELSRAERTLAEIDKWKEDLSKGLPIFSASWRSPQTVPAKKAFEALALLRGDLLQAAGRVRKMLLVKDLADSPEEVKYLIAAFTRHAYSRENYVRGFVEFGQSFKHQDVVNTYSQFLPEAEQNINAAHMFYSLFTSEQNLPPVFYTGLYEECCFLPGIFQTQVHDVHLLLNSYSQDFSYAEMAIVPEYADAWKELGMNPVTAGYWQAWEFTPEAAASWLEVGLADPKLAWFWASQGFDSGEALSWAQAGFFPPMARGWKSQGFTPESALKAMEDEALRAEIQRNEAETQAGPELKSSKEDRKEPEEGGGGSSAEE